MKRTRDNIVKAINSLLKEGDDLKRVDEENVRNDEGGFFSKWRGKRTV